VKLFKAATLSPAGILETAADRPTTSHKMEEPPKYVDVSYKINCISHIDSVTSTYYIDVKLFFHWVDPNFIGRKKNESVDIKTEGSWNPDIIVTNEHELASIEEHREVKVNNPTIGEIKSSIQYRGTLFINVRFARIVAFVFIPCHGNSIAR
jgi:hypothetical protein